MHCPRTGTRSAGPCRRRRQGPRRPKQGNGSGVSTRSPPLPQSPWRWRTGAASGPASCRPPDHHCPRCRSAHSSLPARGLWHPRGAAARPRPATGAGRRREGSHWQGCPLARHWQSQPSSRSCVRPTKLHTTPTAPARAYTTQYTGDVWQGGWVRWWGRGGRGCKEGGSVHTNKRKVDTGTPPTKQAGQIALLGGRERRLRGRGGCGVHTAAPRFPRTRTRPSHKTKGEQLGYTGTNRHTGEEEAHWGREDVGNRKGLFFGEREGGWGKPKITALDGFF